MGNQLWWCTRDQNYILSIVVVVADDAREDLARRNHVVQRPVQLVLPVSVETVVADGPCKMTTTLQRRPPFKVLRRRCGGRGCIWGLQGFKHAYRHMHSHIHTFTHTHTHAYTQTCADVVACICTQTHAHTHKHTRSSTRIHTYTHIPHTYKHGYRHVSACRSLVACQWRLTLQFFSLDICM